MIMKSREELHQELRQRILSLSGVTERQNAGIHEDAVFVGRTMFMHIHGYGHCDIRLAKGDQERILAQGKARPHRWAPEQGYVTFMARDEKDWRRQWSLFECHTIILPATDTDEKINTLPFNHLRIRADNGQRL
jgi:luciferase-like monooxygenase